jgi:hypothetical protein
MLQKSALTVLRRKLRKIGITARFGQIVKWMFQGTIPILTHLTSVFKDGKCIIVSAYPTRYIPEVEQIVESVTLEAPVKITGHNPVAKKGSIAFS